MKEIIAWTVTMCGGCTGEMAGYSIFWLLAEHWCTDFWEERKETVLSLVLYSVLLLVLFFCPVFRTGDYEMYRKNRVLACFVAFAYGSC